MDARSHARRLAAAVAALAVLGVIATSIPHLVRVFPARPASIGQSVHPAPTPTHTRQPEAKKPCAHYGQRSINYANEPSPPKTGPDSFAEPVPLHQAPEAFRMFLCSSERYWAAIHGVLDHGTHPNRPVSNHTWVDAVNRMVDTQVHWSQGRFVHRHFRNQPGTLLMIPGSFPLIEAVAGTTRDDTFYVVPVTNDAGKVIILWLRPECGLQPYLATLAAISAAFPRA